MNTSDAELARSLESAIHEPEFALAFSGPGAWFVRDVRRTRPQIAVIDRVHERPQAAQTEIALLKDCRPDVRIVLLSQEPSRADGALVEQGVFFYLAAPSLTTLTAVIHAAAASLQGEAARRGALR